MNSNEPEKYKQPKEIAAELCSRFGLCVKENYICAVKRESIRRGDGLFVVGQARPSEVFAWLKANPTFRRRNGSVAQVGISRL
jgi:hypothetical protein